MLALLLKVVWPAVAAAQQGVTVTDAIGPSGQPDSHPPQPVTPTPSPTPQANGGGVQPSPTPSKPDSSDTPPPDPTLTKFELYIALAPNRIVFHAATPAQLIKVEDGLQYYFIGRKGKTRLGPWIPSFAELAEKFPDGEEASIYLGSNPFTGKRVKIDYLPTVNRIRVDTFYADRERDKNKHYIFHFGPQHDITYDAW